MLLFTYIDTIKNLLAENRNLFLDKNLFNIAGSVFHIGSLGPSHRLSCACLFCGRNILAGLWQAPTPLMMVALTGDTRQGRDVSADRERLPPHLYLALHWPLKITPLPLMSALTVHRSEFCKPFLLDKVSQDKENEFAKATSSAVAPVYKHLCSNTLAGAGFVFYKAA